MQHGIGQQVQEVYGWGNLHWLSGGSNADPAPIDTVIDIGPIRQIACSESKLLVLTSAGKVYSMQYTTDTQLLQPIEGMSRTIELFTFTG